MFIRTERLFLRPAWAEDASELHAAIANERIVRHLARVPWPYRWEDAQAFVARAPERGLPSLLITQPGACGSRIIGGIGLQDDEGTAALGYWLTPDVWGRGYATESASAVLRLARTLGHKHIRARHFADNPASSRVLQKLGFRPCGPLQERFSLGRGASAPSQGYSLHLDAGAGCANASLQDQGCEIDLCAA